MFLLKLLLLSLAFYGHIATLNATTCPKGQKVTRAKGCENCRPGSYQPVENDSLQCKACTKCDEKSGSVVKDKCTVVSDTKCKCRGKFVPIDSDSSTCKCDAGFGLERGECSKCPDGYFSTTINSPCRKWKECKSAGVNVTGTQTSDVVCFEESGVTTSPTTKTNTVSLLTRLTSHRPHEGAQTQKMLTATTTSPPGHSISTTKKVSPLPPSNTGSHIGMVLLLFGIVGLLVLTAVTCKLHITPYMERQPAIRKTESLCRRPVEESGDGSQSSLKLNPESP